MKKMLLITALLIFGMGFLVWKSVGTGTDHKYSPATIIGNVEYKCGDGASRNYLFLESEKESVRKLGELEGMCGSSITNIVTIRVNIPTNKEIAKVQASTISRSILEIRDKGLTPLLTMESSSTWDEAIFTTLAKGGYNEYILDFLSTLNQAGVKSEDVYGWIVIPQPNLPNWGKKYIAPENFSKYYIPVYDNIVKIFPESDVGVMLSSSTYQEAPVDWSNRDYRTLVPYIVDIPKEKINILGMEGYPSIASVGTTGPMVINPSEYIPKFMIEELYSLVQSKKVLIGTNTFSSLNYDDKEKIVYMPADVRGTVLSETIETIKSYKLNEAKVLMVLSAPSLVDYKGVDWEYFGTPNNQNTRNKTVLVEFLRDLHKNQIKMVFGY